MSDETPGLPIVAPEPAARSQLSRPVLFTIIGLGVAVLVALAVIIALVIPRPSTPVALGTSPTPSATASPTHTPTPTPSRSATPTPTAAPVVVADPAPADPAPADPAPADPAPAPAIPPVVGPPPLPAPPAPILPLTIDSMNAYPNGACGPSGSVQFEFSETGGLVTQTLLSIRSGGIGSGAQFSQTWQAFNSPSSKAYYIDCSARPIWYFTVTITDGTRTKKAMLTMVNGVNQGWSSVG